MCHMTCFMVTPHPQCSARDNKYLLENNIVKQISNTQSVPDDTVLSTTTSKIHNILPSTTALKTISNNIYKKTDLPSNNNKVIKNFPSTTRVPASYTMTFSSVTRHSPKVS